MDSRSRHAFLGDEIAEAAGHSAAAEHRLLKLIAEFDQIDGWVQQGALSCAHWLSWRVGLAPEAAREKVRVALALRELPSIDEAFERGRVSYSKTRAMTRVATPENEADLLNIADSCTASQLERVCRKFRNVVDGNLPPVEIESRRSVRSRHLDDGMVCVSIRLLPDEATRLLAAIDAAAVAEANGVEPDSDSDRPLRPDRADGVMRLADSFVTSAGVSQRRDAACEVILHVEEAGLADNDGSGFVENAGCAHVSAETSRRLTCDAAVVRVTEDEDGNVLDVGRRTRIIPSAIRRALRIRTEGHCEFPGCGNRAFLDAHHIKHWADGGGTRLDNLCLLCRRHHRAVHELGFDVRRNERGEPKFFAPDKRPIPRCGALEPVDATFIEDLAIRHEEEGLGIDEWSITPRHWGGERVDHVQVMDALVRASPSFFGGV